MVVGVVMRHHFKPQIGMWFKNHDYPTSFEVVATDEREGYVEIQHYSGEIEEIDIDYWFDLDITPIPGPDDWNGPFELSKEDHDLFEEYYKPEDWGGPLIDLEPEKH